MPYNDTMKLSHKHRQILDRIFQDPVSGTIKWSDIENLLIALGVEITEGSGSRVRADFGNFLSVYHRPHPGNEAVKGAVRAVRDDLIRYGVAPKNIKEKHS
jgi:hypothetical protein